MSDLSGRLLLYNAYFDNKSLGLDLSHLPAGTYNITATHEDETLNTVLILE